MFRQIQRTLGALGLVFGLAASAQSQMLQPIVGDVPATQHYQGPGDITTFTAWWGLRAYTASAAAATQNVADLRRTSDSATCTIKLSASTGFVDLDVGTPCNSNTQTATAWTTRRTFTGASISGTSLSFTGSSGSSTAGDQIIGTGITAKTTISGSCTTSPCTITPSQTVTSTTITELIPTRITKWYDQTLGNACGGLSCDSVQGVAGTGNQSSFLFPGCDLSIARPCIEYPNTAGTQDFTMRSANNFTPSGAAMSLSVVGFRLNGNGTTLVNGNGSGTDRIIPNASNTWSLAAGTPSRSSVNDGAWHTSNSVIATNPATSTINVDGSESTSTALTLSTSAGKPISGAAPTGGIATLRLTEAGFKDNTSWSSTQRSNLCHSQYVAWGTSTSC